MQREEIFQYIKVRYGTEPEYLWKDNPNAAVLRHHPSNKWYAILMKVPEEKLGLDEKTLVDIIDVKADPAMIGIPAYSDIWNIFLTQCQDDVDIVSK